MSQFKFFLLPFFLPFIATSNLICNGDFQEYTLTKVYLNEPYEHLPPNMSCWYTQGMVIWQVKQKISPPLTKVAQLTATNPYALCQNVDVIPTYNYSLKFSLYSQALMKDMVLSVKLNGILLMQLAISLSEQLAYGEVNFTAQTNLSIICFSETHTIPVLAFSQYVMGGCLDNVTLTAFPPIQIITNTSQQTNSTTNISINSTIISNSSEASFNTSQTTFNRSYQSETSFNISESEEPSVNLQENPIDQTGTNWDNQIIVPQEQIFEIYCETQVNELQNLIYIVSDADYLEDMALYLENNMEIYIQEEFQNGFDLIENQDGKFMTVIEAQRNYNLENVSIIILDDRPKFLQYLKIQFYVNGKPIYFTILSQQQAKVLEKISEISDSISTVVKTIKTYVGSTICSYFILSFLNFWNLSLFYYFLPIKSIPHFTKNAYQELLNFIFIKGSILEWIQKVFSVDLSYDSLGIEEKVKQKVPEWKDNYSWFKNFGISSKIVENNYESSFYFAFIFVKIIVLELILLFIPNSIKKMLQLTVNYHLIFIGELAVLTLLIYTSGISVITEGMTNSEQYMEKSGHFMLLFCFLLIPVCLGVSLSINKLKKEKIQETQEREQQQEEDIDKSRNQINQIYCQWSALFINYTIPIFLYFSPLIFLIVNSFTIVLRLIILVKKWSGLSYYYRFYATFMNSIWILHHSTFFFLFALEAILDQYLLDRQIISEICKYCGIIVLVTVLVGGSFQLLKFLIDSLIYFMKIMKKIFQKFYGNNQISVANSNNQGADNRVKMEFPFKEHKKIEGQIRYDAHDNQRKKTNECDKSKDKVRNKDKNLKIIRQESKRTNENLTEIRLQPKKKRKNEQIEGKIIINIKIAKRSKKDQRHLAEKNRLAKIGSAK